MSLFEKGHIACGARRGGRRPAAFTLVELLVVIAIIALLMGLLVPAVGGAREAARQTQCRNNLKQVALGVLEFENAQGKFPAGINGSRFALPPEKPSHAWAAMILPYVEQQTVYDALFVGELDLETLTGSLSGVSGSADVSAYPAQYQEFVRATSQPLAVFQCPSGLNACRMSSVGGYSRSTGVAVTNYIGSSGVNMNGGMHAGDTGGVLLYQYAFTTSGGVIIDRRLREVTVASIVDGTSNTFMIGERGSFRATNDQANWLGVVAGNTTIGHGAAGKRVMGTTRYTLNPLPAEAPGAMVFGFSSEHAGGGNFAFCDGSVHFLTETIGFSLSSLSDTSKGCPNCGVFQLLSHRRDREPPPSF